MQKIITLSSIYLFSLITVAYGQSIELQGKVKDQRTKEGIAFAHVFIQNTSIGVVTDLYGNFTIQYPEPLAGSTLLISCLGYKATSRILSNGKQNIEITLEQDVVQLQEVVVRPPNVRDILTEAFKLIPINFDTSGVVLSGYYNMTSRLEEKNIRSTEAFLDIYKYPYNNLQQKKEMPRDSIRITEARTGQSDIDDWKLQVMIPWERSLYFLDFRDIVKEMGTKKNSFDVFMSSYDFDLEKSVILNGRSAYMIRMTPTSKKSYWNGYIFIDEETRAFAKIDITSSPNTFRKLKAEMGYIISSKLYNVKYDSGEWKESISYQLIGNKWYLKEINSSKHFVISSKKRAIEKVPVNVSLHYITDSVRNFQHTHDAVEFLPNQNGWAEHNFLRDQYHESFWQEFDRERGIDKAVYVSNNNDSIHSKKYEFTRLDTLQGRLTPWRTCYDVNFYHLDVEVFPEEEQLIGNSEIHFTVNAPFQKMQIDLYSGMVIDSIVWNHKKLPYTREYNAIFPELPEVLKTGSVEKVNVYYQGHPVDFDPTIPLYASFLWVEDAETNPWLQAICQGYGASGWWPNKDHLSDEPDSAAITITVPSALNVVSNGRLKSKVMIEDNRTRYHWFVSYPINNYNLTVNAGDYKHFNDQHIVGKDTLDLDYYVLSSHVERARKGFELVKPILSIYEKYFGPYPFPRDGFKLVETPHAMEHQSCVSIGYEYLEGNDKFDYENDSLDFTSLLDFQIVLHESAHEWWGNNVSCNDNAELWIHESFATYAEALFIEEKYGYEKSQVYLNAFKKGVLNKDPIIGRPHVNHIHYDISDMYGKGALMLNTFRHVLNNDTLWFDILKGIQSSFQYQIVTTTDIVNYINKMAGKNYTYFFDQYLRFTEIPQLEIEFEAKDGGTVLNYRWKADVPDFRMPIQYKLSSIRTGYLFPTQSWQSLELTETTKENFLLNEDQFFITIIKN